MKRTPEEERARVEAFADAICKTVPAHVFAAFVEKHQKEISRQVTIFLLNNPRFNELLGSETLRKAAEVIVWISHMRGGDDWKRPRKPRPMPPKPLTPNARTRDLVDA